VQISINEIDGERQQAVAKQDYKPGRQRHFGLFAALLGLGGKNESVGGAAKPAEIKPGEDGAEGEAKGPGFVAESCNYRGGGKADEECQPSDAALGLFRSVH